ncbi:MAG: hypothetical protein JW729_07315, partial [Bacteroidales bacterium]|nr:hypothetical protein [Bacteroidales bacterium]
VQEIQKSMSNNDQSKVIIFGTETTISEDKHRSQLISSGIAENRIIVQACPQLQQYIEHNPKGEDTEMLIMSYVDEAMTKNDNPKNDIYVSLNCTHFGYAGDLWTNGFEFAGASPKSIINPNIQLSEILLKDEFKKGYGKTEIKIQVVSKVRINPENVNSIAEILKEQSVATSNALLKYEVVNNLF